MADDRQRILDRIDIVDLVGQRVSLKRTGKTYKGLCPFHDEKNPSFTVNVELGKYRCWSCGEHGDAFTWVMKTQNMDFVEALRHLAKVAGIELSGAVKGPSKEEKAERADAMALALDFFKEQFAKSEEAKTYTEGRGLSADQIALWEIGYSPAHGEALASWLRRKNLSLSEAKELFLVSQDQSGSYYDMFRGRLMFPIRDERGNLVAFGGRILGKGDPKYINSSDTPIYRKSRVLYGFDRARNALQRSRKLVLVEGYLDVIACHAAGVNTAVASCGTALAEEQCRLIRRWADDVVVLYDGDAAGVKATRRAIEMLAAEGLRVKVAMLEPQDDPDTLLRSKGPAALQALVADAVLPVEFEFKRLIEDQDPKEPAFWESAVRLLAATPNAMELEKYLQRLAPLYPGLTDVMAARKALRQEVLRSKRFLPRPSVVREAASTTSKSKLPGSEVAVVAALMHEVLRPLAWSALEHREWFLTQAMSDFALALRNQFQTVPAGEAKLWISQLPDSCQSVFEEVSVDPRRSRVTEKVLEDALAYLKKKTAERTLQGVRTEIANDQDRQAYLDALKPLKNVANN